MDDSSNVTSDILYISFNEDNSRLSIGTQTGFSIYNTLPLNLCINRQFGEGIGIIEMLERTNIMALVGGGIRPKYMTHCVILWDDHTQKPCGEVEYPSAVMAVKMTQNRIIVALRNKVYVHEMETLRLIGSYHTNDCCSNKLLAANKSLLAFSHTDIGNVLWKHFNVNNYSKEEVPKQKQMTLSELQLIAVNTSGDKIAAVSSKGTLIRVYNTRTDEMISLRRGTTFATIQSISFSPDSRLLACTSNHGTVHIFDISNDNESKPTSYFQYFGIMTGSSEQRASLTFSIAETCESVCAFVKSERQHEYRLLIVASSGNSFALEIARNDDCLYSFIGECEKGHLYNHF